MSSGDTIVLLGANILVVCIYIVSNPLPVIHRNISRHSSIDHVHVNSIETYQTHDTLVLFVLLYCCLFHLAVSIPSCLASCLFTGTLCAFGC